MSNELNNQIKDSNRQKMLEALSNREDNLRKVAEYEREAERDLEKAQTWAWLYYTKERLEVLSKKSQELLGRNDFGLDQYLKKFSNSKDITKKDIDTLVQRYLNNPITTAIIMAGLEPFDSFSDLLELVAALRVYTTDEIIIYSGYTKEESENGWFYMENRNSNTRRMAYQWLKTFPNIIIKFGRYQLGDTPHYDEVLGIKLASDNQYAEVTS